MNFYQITGNIMGMATYQPHLAQSDYLDLLRNQNVYVQAEKTETKLARSITEGKDNLHISNIAAQASMLYAQAFYEMFSVQHDPEAISFYERGLLLYEIAEKYCPRNNALKPIQEFYLTRKDYPYPLLRKSDRIVSKAKREAYARAKTIGYL
jgi:hypothetical protein